MTQLSCPACGKPLYLPLIEEELEADRIICRNCHYLYRLKYLEVEKYSETIISKKGDSKLIDRIINCELKCITTKGQTESITFSLPLRKKTFSLSPGDKIFLLYTRGGGLLKSELVAIVNCTANCSYRLFSIINKNHGAGLKASLLGFFASTCLVTSWVNLQGKYLEYIAYIFFPTGIISGISVFQYRRKQLIESNTQIVKRLSFEQSMLQGIHAVSERIDKLNGDLEQENNLIKKLESVREKMNQTDCELYQERIDISNRGIQALEEQSQLSINLVAGYQKVKNMLEIEYQTSKLADQLPGDSSSLAFQKIEELEQLEEQKEQISLMLNPQELSA